MWYNSIMIIKKLLTYVLATIIGLSSFIGTRVWMDSQSFSAPRSYVLKAESDQGSGSLVMVAPGLALTAAHVSGTDGNRLKVNGQLIKVVKINFDLDVALVAVSAPCPCAPLGVLPEEDDRVVAVGFPLTVSQFATVGHMQGLSPNNNHLLASAPIIFGNSGGGLFAFQQGQWKLVGITVNMAGANLGMFGVPVPHIVGSVPITSIMEWLHDRRS